jgi:hypothetical protein
MKQKLNLSILNKSEVEMTKKEMGDLRAGGTLCDTRCEHECMESSELRVDAASAVYYTKECPCGSIWVVFGLALV